MDIMRLLEPGLEANLRTKSEGQEVGHETGKR